VGTRPSVAAAAVLVTLRKARGLVPFWPVALQVRAWVFRVSGYYVF
jgi:hypothetical protein